MVCTYHPRTFKLRTIRVRITVLLIFFLYCSYIFSLSLNGSIYSYLSAILHSYISTSPTVFAICIAISSTVNWNYANPSLMQSSNWILWNRLIHCIVWVLYTDYSNLLPFIRIDLITAHSINSDIFINSSSFASYISVRQRYYMFIAIVTSNFLSCISSIMFKLRISYALRFLVRHLFFV